jgi:phenylacetic acid degradation protein paaN
MSYPFNQPILCKTQLCHTWCLDSFISFPRKSMELIDCSIWQKQWVDYRTKRVDFIDLVSQVPFTYQQIKYPLGAEAQGILLYQSDGYMSAHLNRQQSKRSLLSKQQIEQASQAAVEEKAQAFDEYVAYAGTWNLEWHSDSHHYVMTHHVQSALYPNLVGQPNVRHIDLYNDYLILSYDVQHHRGTFRYCLIWKAMQASRVSQAMPHTLQSHSSTHVNHNSKVIPSKAQSWFQEHQGYLYKAADTYRSREAWSPFIESPSGKKHPVHTKSKAYQAFQSYLNKPFIFAHTLAGQDPNQAYLSAAESSPYTRQSLGTSYPHINLNQMQIEIHNAFEQWQEATLTERFGIAMEILKRWAAHTFLNMYATMHTTGQSFMLAFAGSGASSLDRGLEVVAASWSIMKDLPKTAEYQRDFGVYKNVNLSKKYQTKGVGLAIVFACGSYPAWNAYPAILANLLTGNSVLVKPHPHTILPMALMINFARQVIEEAGYNPNLLSMCTDQVAQPIGLDLLNLPHTRIVDFTGSQAFGSLIETQYAHLQVYTETAGCNAVILESTRDLSQTVYVLAHALCFFSAQMCTAPQNIWIASTGLKVYRDDTHHDDCSVTDFIDLLIKQINYFVTDPQSAAQVCAALHSEQSYTHMKNIKSSLENSPHAQILRTGHAYEHPEFNQARTATPMVIQLDHYHRSLAQKEHFAPISFIIIAPNVSDLVTYASQDAADYGAIASYLYSVDQEYCDQAIQAFHNAGASLGINLHRHIPIHYTAAMSDYHVTGLNPAGTACLTDPAFITRRFKILQSKTEKPKLEQ